MAGTCLPSLGRMKLADLVPSDGLPSDSYKISVSILSQSLAQFSAVIVQFPTTDGALLRSGLESARSQFIPIDCLSNSTYFVSAILSVNLINSLPGSCSVIKRLLVPVARQERFGENLRDDLNADLQLTWDKPDCSFCETHGLMC
ncbi:putative RING-H2 finger protein ATL21A [Trifolium repens]|nr:putative RING-H2 finger protein ATL21A [Trifolium repens]